MDEQLQHTRTSMLDIAWWASGPADYAPPEYQWGYNRMMTVAGLFGAGDTIGGTAHKFSSGSFTEGRIAGKVAAADTRTPTALRRAVDAL